VAGGSLAGNDHSLMSSTVGRVEAGSSSPVSSTARVGLCGSPGCGSRMPLSLIVSCRSHNEVSVPRTFVLALIDPTGRIDQP
jgi:hypothetical protein